MEKLNISKELFIFLLLEFLTHFNLIVRPTENETKQGTHKISKQKKHFVFNIRVLPYCVLECAATM